MLLRSFKLFAAVLIGIATLSGQEPEKPKLSPKIMTATRQMSMFTGLETQMLRAVQKKDKAAVQAMLADDFAIEMPDANRLEGEDWLDSVIAQGFTLTKFGVGQVSLEDLGDAAVLKFVRVQEATFKGASDNGEFFVTDLW